MMMQPDCWNSHRTVHVLCLILSAGIVGMSWPCSVLETCLHACIAAEVDRREPSYRRQSHRSPLVNVWVNPRFRVTGHSNVAGKTTQGT